MSESVLVFIQDLLNFLIPKEDYNTSIETYSSFFMFICGVAILRLGVESPPRSIEVLAVTDSFDASCICCFRANASFFSVLAQY